MLYKFNSLIATAESETNSNRNKTCITPTNRRKLVHEIYASKSCTWKEQCIYTKKLNTSQIIFWVCHVK